MANLAAVIQERSYDHIAGSSFIAWIYDKDQPRIPESNDPTARYACIDSLGPFTTIQQAMRAARDRIA